MGAAYKYIFDSSRSHQNIRDLTTEVYPNSVKHPSETECYANVVNGF